MDVREAIQRCGGAARTGQLRRFGITPEQFIAAAVDGTIARLRKGVYANESRSDVAVAAAHGGAVTCMSALRAHGVWLLDDELAVHVNVGINGRVHDHFACHCIDHHEGTTTAFGTASVADALRTAWRCLTTELFFVAYESAWRLGLLTATDRDRVLKAVPERIARWLRRARGNADSGIESLFRYRMMLLGIEFESQVVIPDVGRVDFRHGRLLVEVDGRVNHEGHNERVRDLQRDANSMQAGYMTLRLTYAMIVHDWARTEATVLAAIEDLSFIPSR